MPSPEPIRRPRFRPYPSPRPGRCWPWWRCCWRSPCVHGGGLRRRPHDPVLVLVLVLVAVLALGGPDEYGDGDGDEDEDEDEDEDGARDRNRPRLLAGLAVVCGAARRLA